jgi:hypothetical protein
MVRESPAGGYFDASPPLLDAVVASLADCVLVSPPGTATKYSNIGVTVNGWLLEKICSEPFDAYQRREILDPLGMKISSFTINEEIREQLAIGRMRAADGRGGFQTIDAPLFDLGTDPAGNLYSTVEEMALFWKMIFAEGRAGETKILRSNTLEKMFVRQGPEGPRNFGLGFALSQYRQHTVVGHSGAVYGFSTATSAIPEQKLAVVIFANEDLASGAVTKLRDASFAALLNAKCGEPLPEEEKPFAPPREDLQAYAGDYESESYWARIEVRDGQLRATLSGQEFTLAAAGPDRFWGEHRNALRAPWNFLRNAAGIAQGFTALDQTFRRVDPRTVREIPEAWKDLLGGYGPEFIPLVISARHGHLYAMIENEYDYCLTPLNRLVFKLPPGMYADEQLVFQRNEDGRVRGVVFANMALKKNDLPEGGIRDKR